MVKLTMIDFPAPVGEHKSTTVFCVSFRSSWSIFSFSVQLIGESVDPESEGCSSPMGDSTQFLTRLQIHKFNEIHIDLLKSLKISDCSAFPWLLIFIKLAIGFRRTN